MKRHLTWKALTKRYLTRVTPTMITLLKNPLRMHSCQMKMSQNPQKHLKTANLKKIKKHNNTTPEKLKAV